MQCAIIDQRIGWYGSVNLIGHFLADTNVIRMASSDLSNALMDALRLWKYKKNMGTATSERFQAPARQGHFVVTAELPEIQTVTVWTPCCAPMSTLSNNGTWMDCLWGLSGGCADVEGEDFGWNDTGDEAISIVYSDIHVQPYAISDQKCLVGMKNYPLLCDINDTNRLRRESSNRVDDMRCLLIILWHLTVIDWLRWAKPTREHCVVGQSVEQLNLRQVTIDFQRDRFSPMRGW